MKEEYIPKNYYGEFPPSLYKWKKIQKLERGTPNKPSYVSWGPWDATVNDLLDKGWELIVETNVFNKKKWLYVRDPKTKQFGRGELKENANTIWLDFFCPERNGRIKKHINYINEEIFDFVINEETLPLILQEIQKYQEKSLKPKPKRKPSAEVIELAKKKYA